MSELDWMSDGKTVWVDPPAGWAYGWPKKFTIGKDDLETMLRESGYPEKSIPMALKHSRYIQIEEE